VGIKNTVIDLTMVFGALFDESVKKKETHASSGGDKSSPKNNQNKRKHPKAQNKPQASASRNNSQPDQFNKRPRFDDRKRRGPPSREALDLSARLKELSSQKRLQQALQLYRDKSNDKIRDCHHACSVIDCAARCGAIDEGERVFEDMKKTGMMITIETYTALLKGYAHGGMMHKGALLFEEMCRQGNPNVRSVNTLLRGCLWTAATLENGTLAGGVVTSEVAWRRAGKFNQDASSFEYYITQLCQALRLEDAQQEITRLKQVLKIETKKGKKSDTFEAQESSALEALAVCLLALARAQAMLGREARHSVLSTINAVDAAKANAGSAAAAGAKNSHGGKRSWKKDEGAQRIASNTLYRGHRLSELRNEATALLELVKGNKAKAVAVAHNLSNLLMKRLFYFSGGGSTGLSIPDACNEDADDVIQQLMTTRWTSFGLKTALAKAKRKNLPFEKTASPDLEQCKTIAESLGLEKLTTVDQNGFLAFSELFDSKETNRPLDIELGSGFGDWAVYQAKNKPERDFVAVELRADRVAQTFSRIVLNETPLTNLSCVGAECGSFLKARVKNDSVSTIFVNHPEPPTQTYGGDDDALTRISEGGDEPGHMLSSSILVAAVECLDPKDGQLIIVTDNRMYARLICASVQKAMKTHPSLIEPVALDTMRKVESFGSVTLYEGQPGASIRHAEHSGKEGQSYFDRLWKTGAGSHSERSQRFIVALRRDSDGKKKAEKKNSKKDRK
jgi:pentatricopeptide repeat protein